MSGMEDGKSKKEWQDLSSITIAQRMVRKKGGEVFSLYL
jgi:hypothetical protein